MPFLLYRLTRAYSFVTARLPGAFLLVVGILFLYWSGRGLLAYGAGIRAPQSDLVACGAGMLAGGLCLWAGTHLLRDGVPGTPNRAQRQMEAIFDKARTLLDRDPAAATRLLDDYFVREAADTAARRGQLRQRAAHDLKAAVALRLELQEEVRGNTRFRKDILTRIPEPARADHLVRIDSSVSELNQEILQLNSTIDRLKRG